MLQGRLQDVWEVHVGRLWEAPDHPLQEHREGQALHVQLMARRGHALVVGGASIGFIFRRYGFVFVIFHRNYIDGGEKKLEVCLGDVVIWRHS